MNPGQLSDKLQANSVPTIVLDESQTPLRGLVRAVEAHVRSFDPAVLHAHRHKENLIALFGARTSPRKRRGLVTTVHGMPEPIRSRNVLRSGARNIANALALRWGFDAIVGVSHDIASTLQPRYPTGRVTCIHNGVPVPEHRFSARADSGGPLSLLALGRLVPVKRFERLKALSMELERSTGLRPRITLAGEGPLRSELERTFEGAANIRMPGFVPRAAELLREADALVMTSDHEGIPMAVLEALAGGVPVFAFGVGGLPEIAAPGLPLYLAPPGNVAALAGDIARYFTEPGFRARIPPPPDWSFSIRRCAESYESLYTRIRPTT